jgi:hypothetical protein
MRIVRPSTGGVVNETDPVYLAAIAAVDGVVVADGAGGVDEATNLQDVAYLPLAGKAADSDKLDNKDSTEFAASSHQHGGGDVTSAVASATNADTVDSKHVGTSGNKIPLLDGTNVWSGDQDLSGSVLKIPNAASPTVDATGETALDTTAKQLLIYDGAAASVFATPTRSFTFVLDLPQANDVFEIICLDRDISLVLVTGYTIAGTNYTFNIEVRAAGTPQTVGSDVMTADLIAVPGGATSALAAAAANIAAGKHLVMVATSMSGVPTKLIIRVDYTEDRK